MKNYLTKLTVAGAVVMSAAGSAMAGSVSEPGEAVGGAPGAALPPGLYFVEEDNWGARSTGGGAQNTLGVNINALVWSTPWQLAGARVMLTGVAITAEAGNTGAAGNPPFYLAGAFNPLFIGTLAWNLGGGFNFSYSLAGYIPTSSQVADPGGAIENRIGLSYLKDGWNLSAQLLYGVHTTDETLIGHPNYFNVDATVAKKLGKWEIGAVGFYSTDTQVEALATGGLGKQSQFALGALVGYDWGPLITQVYVTHDVFQQNYGAEDLRVWGRLIVPLGDPLANGSPGAMFHK